jgi:hypothetical protein
MCALSSARHLISVRILESNKIIGTVLPNPTRRRLVPRQIMLRDRPGRERKWLSCFKLPRKKVRSSSSMDALVRNVATRQDVARQIHAQMDELPASSTHIDVVLYKRHRHCLLRPFPSAPSPWETVAANYLILQRYGAQPRSRRQRHRRRGEPPTKLHPR